VKPRLIKVGRNWQVHNLGVPVVSGLRVFGKVKTGGVLPDLIFVRCDALEHDRDIGFILHDLHPKAVHRIENPAILGLDPLIMTANIPKIAEVQVRDPIMPMKGMLHGSFSFRHD